MGVKAVPSLRGVGRGQQRLALPGMMMPLVAPTCPLGSLGENRYSCSVSLKVPRQVGRCLGSSQSRVRPQREMLEDLRSAGHSSKLFFWDHPFKPL